MIDAKVAKRVRQGFRYFNKFMVMMWRMGMGRVLSISPEILGQYLVLGHTGRKSGILRRTPLNFAIVEGEVYCTAGFGPSSDWFRDIKANPVVEVWLPDGWWAGEATEVTDSPRRLPLLRAVLIGSGFAARVAGVNPQQISDDELDRLTREYALVHVQRTRARTGKDGPGDLAWLWLPIAFLLGRLTAKRNKRTTK